MASKKGCHPPSNPINIGTLTGRAITGGTRGRHPWGAIARSSRSGHTGSAIARGTGGRHSRCANTGAGHGPGATHHTASGHAGACADHHGPSWLLERGREAGENEKQSESDPLHAKPPHGVTLGPLGRVSVPTRGGPADQGRCCSIPITTASFERQTGIALSQLAKWQAPMKQLLQINRVSQ